MTLKHALASVTILKCVPEAKAAKYLKQSRIPIHVLRLLHVKCFRSLYDALFFLIGKQIGDKVTLGALML